MFTAISVRRRCSVWAGWFLYYRKPAVAAPIADVAGGLYQAVVHKYYIDEFYGALFVKPLIDGSTEFCGKGSTAS